MRTRQDKQEAVEVSAARLAASRAHPHISPKEGRPGRKEERLAPSAGDGGIPLHSKQTWRGFKTIEKRLRRRDDEWTKSGLVGGIGGKLKQYRSGIQKSQTRLQAQGGRLFPTSPW